MTLRRAGFATKQIARMLTVDRRTVTAWLTAGRFPERATRTTRMPRLVDRFRTEVAAYDDAGGDSAKGLAERLAAHGDRGQRVTVWRALGALRADRPRAGGAVPLGAASTVRVPSATSTAWLLRKPAETRTPDQQRVLAALLPACPRLAEATRLADDVVRILREHDAAAVDAWLTTAAQSELPSFAVGIRRDEVAVRAAVTSCWSHGQVEGQVHRLKLVKRSMYGRSALRLPRRVGDLRLAELRRLHGSAPDGGCRTHKPTASLFLTCPCFLGTRQRCGRPEAKSLPGQRLRARPIGAENQPPLHHCLRNWSASDANMANAVSLGVCQTPLTHAHAESWYASRVRFDPPGVVRACALSAVPAARA